MDTNNLKKLQAASAASTGGSSSSGWEILAYTDYPKKTEAFANFNDWTTGYTNGAPSTLQTFNGNRTTIPATFDTSVPIDRFGKIGRHEFQSHTETDSGANNRTSEGDGDGWYSAAYNKTNLTKIALVGVNGSDTVDLTNPTNSTNHLVYNLVGTSGTESDADMGTGTYTVISLLQTLALYNRNNTTWHSNGTITSDATNHNLLFNGPNCRNFTSGGGSRTQAGYSGVLQSAAGKMHHIGDVGTDSGDEGIDTTNYPNLFCFWGIDLDSDHDTQVCAAYYGGGPSVGSHNPYGDYMALGRSNDMGLSSQPLATQTTYLKKDRWRNTHVAWTFWSMWGNDWHTDTLRRNISGSGVTTDPTTGHTFTQDETTTAAQTPSAANLYRNEGTDYTFTSGGPSTVLSWQTPPGTVTPKNNVTVDPSLYMCQKVYLLGY
jgi:hypothetical protein